MIHSYDRATIDGCDLRFVLSCLNQNSNHLLQCDCDSRLSIVIVLQVVFTSIQPSSSVTILQPPSPLLLCMCLNGNKLSPADLLGYERHIACAHLFQLFALTLSLVIIIWKLMQFWRPLIKLNLANNKSGDLGVDAIAKDLKPKFFVFVIELWRLWLESTSDCVWLEPILCRFRYHWINVVELNVDGWARQWDRNHPWVD